MKANKIMTIFIMSTVLTASVSCQTRNQSNKATATQKGVLDTNTAIPVKPTTTLAPTETPLPTASQTPTSAATWTPLPTLSEEDKIDIIRILIETNGWCRFPCWWGITPGETTWQEAKQFLGTFSKKIIEDYQQEILDDATYPIGYHDILVQVPNEGRETYIRFVEKDGVVVRIMVPQFYKESEFYPPYRILQEYGRPDEVFLRSHIASYAGYWSLALHLVYQEKSFEATYLIIDAVNQDGIIKGCLGKDGANFRLYLPEYTIKIEDIYDIHSKVTIIVLDLEEATGMDVQSFYETYSNPEDPLCLETSEDLWRK